MTKYNPYLQQLKKEWEVKMSFIDAVYLIKKHNLELCDDEEEILGIYPSICVYHNNEFVGKLRWSEYDTDGKCIRPAHPDPELADYLINLEQFI